VTNALGTSPIFSSGGDDAHFEDAAVLGITFSTCTVEMFSPPLMMTSFARS